MSKNPIDVFETAAELRDQTDTEDGTDAADADENPCIAGTVRCNGPDADFRSCPKCEKFDEIRTALDGGPDL